MHQRVYRRGASIAVALDHIHGVGADSQVATSSSTTSHSVDGVERVGTVRDEKPVARFVYVARVSSIPRARLPPAQRPRTA